MSDYEVRIIIFYFSVLLLSFTIFLGLFDGREIGSLFCLAFSDLLIL